MRFTTSAVAALLAGLLATVDAASIPRRGLDACGQIHQAFSGHNSSTPRQIPGELMLKCLKAMPYEKPRANKLVKEFGKWLQFQSDIEILKNPPPDYQMPPADLLGALEDIQSKIDKGQYESHYDFDTDLNNLIISAYDGHLGLGVCSYNNFAFSISAALVSISTNGTALPEVYTATDAKLAKAGAKNISPIVSINGLSVEDYLSKLSMQSNSQDWDANYNSVFASNPMSLALKNGVGNEYNGNFQASTIFSSAYYALYFANGTTKVLDTYVEATKFPWRSGKELYEQFCLPQNATGSSGSESSSSKPIPAPVGYPKPAYREDANSIMAFFPETKELEDIAVLAIPTFNIDTQRAIDQFTEVGRNLILDAAHKGKKKIIIDLQANGGGVITVALNLFRQFFPEAPIYGAQRFRASEGIDFIGEAFERLPLENNVTMFSLWGWKSNVKPDQTEGFKSWKDLFGPHDTLGLPASSLYSNNFTLQGQSNYINGYGNATVIPNKALFAPEDIIIITDGTCASSCTIFSELMKAQGVRSIAFGGRPRNAPMQAIGGIKGSQVLEMTDISTQVDYAKKLVLKSESTSSPLLSKEDWEKWDKYVPIPLEEFPYNIKSGSINLLNAYGPSSDSVPRQYIYEAAECRRFYTYDNVLEQETTWASAADAMFNDGGCVPGSEEGPGSLGATSS